MGQGDVFSMTDRQRMKPQEDGFRSPAHQLVWPAQPFKVGAFFESYIIFISSDLLGTSVLGTGHLARTDLS